MFTVLGKTKIRLFVGLVALAGSVCHATAQLDKSKYIRIDEIRPGMEAYCLTVYEDEAIEKFDLEVLSVVRNVRPGRDAILVQGTDERFIHTGPVAGCSGSPVYIDGRLAGALAFAWLYSKDPLYGVTPIEEMLRVGQGNAYQQEVEQAAYVLDFSRPIDFEEVYDNVISGGRGNKSGLSGASRLPCPLVTSGLPPEVVEQLNTLVEPLGLMAVAGLGGTTGSNDIGGAELVPGAALAVPLVTGDISISAIGTVTDVIDDRVYGFGHGFLGYGRIDLPMAGAKVHTVVSNLFRSFKVATATQIVGALSLDESSAVSGQIGAKAKMIPLTIKVSRYNDTETRFYNCRVANNRTLTPLVLVSSISGASLVLGSLPPDHTIEYEIAIGTKGFDTLKTRNVSTVSGLRTVVTESLGAVALLMNNPYQKVDITSLDFDIRISAENTLSHIWSVDVSNVKVKAGQQIKLDVVLESVLAGKKKYSFNFKIPNDLPAGKYNLTVSGWRSYRDFLARAAAYRFTAENLESLFEAINNALNIRRDKLYCTIEVSTDGIVLERAELPDLPGTKTLILQNAKRTLKVQPYKQWLEKHVETGTIVIDKRVIPITVER